MKTVIVYINNQVAGYLALENGRITSSPSNHIMDKMLKDSIFDLATGDTINADKEPDRFLDNLAANYSGSYFRATSPQYLEKTKLPKIQFDEPDDTSTGELLGIATGENADMDWVSPTEVE